MKAITKARLLHSWAYCDLADKSTEFMLEYMQAVAGVDLDCVLNFIEKSEHPFTALPIDIKDEWIKINHQ